MFNIPNIDEKKLNGYNLLTLAFVGDSVYSLYVRQSLIKDKDYLVNDLNKEASSIVSAICQAKKVEELLPILTEEEIGIYKRARNIKKGTKAKNASINTYNKATGFEAVIGYLYLKGDEERLNYLLNYKENKDES